MVNDKSKLFIKAFSAILVLGCIVFLTVSCGGGSGSGSSTRTGVFEDALVSGLTYSTVPGGLTGVTNAKGEFHYKKDDVVSFSVGNIILGSGMAKDRMTPLDLVTGTADIDDPAVVNIARFLQSLDVNAGKGLIELPAGLADSVNSWLIIQAGTPFGFDPDVYDFDAMAEDLFDYLEAQMAVYSSGMLLVSDEDAVDHMIDMLLGGYDGSYYGTYSGDDSGKWCFQISDGVITGTAWDKNGDAYDLFGAIQPGGDMAAGTADDSSVFTGVISDDGSISGTWLYSNPFDPPVENGKFSGKTGNCNYGNDPVIETDNDGDGFTAEQGDCDDSNPNVFPGATEICGNSVDEDCSGSDLSCSPDDIDDGQNLELVLGTMTQALGQGGGASEAAEMIETVIAEMGLEQLLDQGYTPLQLMNALNGYAGECGTTQRVGNTLVYTIDGAGNELCIFKSGTVTLSGLNISGDFTRATLNFDDVQSAECSLDGTAEVEIHENDGAQMVVEIAFTDMTTCSGEAEGSVEAVYSPETDTLVSASAEFTASYVVDETNVDADADLEYSPAGGIDGVVTFTYGEYAYFCTFNNVVLTDCNGVLVATAGAMAVSSDELSSDVTFDFSGTTCGNPNVSATVGGVLVNFTFD